eukprot:g13501.t1
MSTALVMKAYSFDGTQFVLSKLSTAATRFGQLWESGGHKMFHYGFIPLLTLTGLQYTNDLSLGMLLASVNPLLL